MRLLQRIRKKFAATTETFEFTLENSGLTCDQIKVAKWALKLQGLETKRSCLSRHDLVRLCYGVGLNPTDELVTSKLTHLKINMRLSFSLEHFSHLWYQLHLERENEKEMLKRAFHFFDRDGNGEISMSELRTTMRDLGDLLTEEEIQQLENLMDVNNDGVIDYSEFINMLHSQLEAGTLLEKSQSAKQMQGKINMHTYSGTDFGATVDEPCFKVGCSGTMSCNREVTKQNERNES